MLAVVFPGQGAQKIGMALDFARHSACARAVLEEADEAAGVPLSRWIAEGPEERLQRTEVTQPAILAASVAIYRVLEPELPAPVTFLAGHSLGEYTALVAAGALELSDAIRLVRRRGALMQEAVPEGEGAMQAVLGLPGEQVERICTGIEGLVAPANYNAPVQTVIAGERSAVEAASNALRAAGATRLVPLPVSAPFHCALMAPAMEKLTPMLAETTFRDVRVPVVSNVTAEPYREASRARVLLREQICAPVRWVDCVRTLVREGVRVQLEVGPDRVLSGLAAKIDRSLRRAHVASLEERAPALACIGEAAA